MKLKVVIVDDEQPICDEMEYLLSKHLDMEVMAKFTNCQEAVQCIVEKNPDVVFLDIKMPGMSGLELAHKLNVLRQPPFIIFVTAFQEHAIEAFDTPAVGYITKPVTEEKLAQVLNKVRNFTAKSAPAAATSIGKICALHNNRIIPLDKKEIVFVYVKDKEVFIRTRTTEYSAMPTMQEFEELLGGGHFLRVHRQYIVNLDEVREITPWFHGSYLLIMNDTKKQEVPVSRNKVKQLKHLLGLK
ncbi:MAG TPA: LytTR family DNA-binding domain-containing protein [Patescibacteria group bacterium]|nr:LytTR family DNA-binding domain-containing protein [Patescibacteria group bacterium]